MGERPRGLGEGRRGRGRPAGTRDEPSSREAEGRARAAGAAGSRERAAGCPVSGERPRSARDHVPVERLWVEQPERRPRGPRGQRGRQLGAPAPCPRARLVVGDGQMHADAAQDLVWFFRDTSTRDPNETRREGQPVEQRAAAWADSVISHPRGQRGGGTQPRPPLAQEDAEWGLYRHS